MFKPRGAKGRMIEAQRCPERKRKEDKLKFKTGGGPNDTKATQRCKRKRDRSLEAQKEGR